MGEEGSGVGEKGTCCFTGHRPSKLPWGTREEDPRCVALKGRIAAALEEEYAAGVRHFISGTARGAALDFAEAVPALKERRPDLPLEASRPRARPTAPRPARRLAGDGGWHKRGPAETLAYALRKGLHVTILEPE